MTDSERHIIGLRRKVKELQGERDTTNADAYFAAGQATQACLMLEKVVEALAKEVRELKAMVQRHHEYVTKQSDWRIGS
jgi:hypothetical protein